MKTVFSLAVALASALKRAQVVISKVHHNLDHN
jgi:hypothetical protein